MRTTRLGSVVVGALLFAALMTGCTATEEQPTVEATATTKPRQTDAPSPPAFWELIAERQIVQWNSWQEGWDAVACGEIADAAAGGIDCTVLVLTANSMADTDAMEWSNATTPGQPGFISVAPPAEVADLVASIQAAAEAASIAGQEWMAAGCDTSTAGDCGALAASLEAAFGELQAERDAWELFLSTGG